MLILCVNLTPSSTIKTRTVPATYAAHLKYNKRLAKWMHLNMYYQFFLSVSLTSEIDLVKTIGEPFHMTMVVLHPLNRRGQCQRSVHDCSILNQMTPKSIKRRIKMLLYKIGEVIYLSKSFNTQTFWFLCTHADTAWPWKDHAISDT